MNITDYALFYASKKWRVFPITPRGKTPAVKWVEECSIVYDKIREWWAENPYYNVGLVTGGRSGIVVLDVDPAHNGDESLFALISEYGPLPPTPEAITGGGGRHLLFAHPGMEIRNSAGKLGAGLDIRGDGGYIVAPPSIHPNGKLYEWEAMSKPSMTPLAPMPAWMLSILQDKKPNKETVYTGPTAIMDGARNQTLTSMAGSMRRRGFDEDAIFTALKEHNRKYCQPPLPDEEVLIIAKSISRYAPADVPSTRFKKNGNKRTLERREPLNAYESIFVFLDLLNNLEGRSIPTFIPPIDKALGGLERQTLTILAARPSMGKSTLAWQIARNVSTNGMKSLFISCEMSVASLWAKAACGAEGLRWRDFRAGEVSEEQKANVIVRAYDLMNKYEDRLLIDDGMNNTETIWQNVERHRPDIVVIDHLRLLADEGDNENLRLGHMTAKLKDMAKTFNCSVLCLSQLNRDTERRDKKRPQLADLRESGHIEENADVVLMMYREDYYNDDKPPLMYSETELLVRKFRDDILMQRIVMGFDLKHQWFDRRQP